MISARVRACLDSTVLLGARANPQGPNRAIFRLAHAGIFEAVVLDSVIAEVRRNLIRGSASIPPHNPEAADAFLGILLGPAISVTEIATVVDASWRHPAGRPDIRLGEVVGTLLEAAGLDTKPSVRIPPDLCVGEVSPKDLHVLVGAVVHDADYIVTSNYDDFPRVPRLPRPRRIKPYSFYDLMR